MKKILLIMPYGSVGGMERLALNFYHQYQKEGFEVKAVKIIQLESDIIHFGADEIALSTIDFNEMSFLKRFWFYIKIPFILRKIISQHQITHSIAFGDMANVFSSLTFTKEFKIASIHSYKSIEFLEKNFLNKVFKFAFKTSYYFFDKVVCISNAVKSDLIEKCGYKFKNLEVIYNPHDLESIKLLSEACFESDFEEKIFQKKVIVFIGRITNVKAPWHLLKSFSLLKEPDAVLVFIGDGSDSMTELLDELIADLGIGNKVFFLGRKSNPYHYLKHASVLVLTSYYEGTPNVIVEAIATNTPVVSSNCTGGIVELMSVGQNDYIAGNIITESGIITPNFFKGDLSYKKSEGFTEEETAFANALASVLKDSKYKENLLKHRAQLLAKFDLSTIATRYLSSEKK